MTIFSKDKSTKPVNTVFTLPVDDSIGPKGLLRSEYVKEQASYIYPGISNTPKAEVQAFLDSGLVGPLQARAEAATAQKKVDIYNETIEVSMLDQKTPEQALAELETLRDTNPFLKAYVSPAVLEALKQSENPTARRFAQGKLANVLIAAEILNNKQAEASTGFINGVGDFLDVAASDLPVVSAFNVKRRKELRDRFIQVLDSTDDAAVIAKELQTIVDEAADMGFFTDANRFYLNDFLGLTLEKGEGQELTFQKVMAGADILVAAGALGDAGKLIGLTRKSLKETSEVLMEGVLKDNPAGAVDPATWKESLITPDRVGPRPPIEAQAVKDVELDLQGRMAAIEIKTASGSSIDDDLFDAFSAGVVSDTKKRAEKAGNLRLNDVTVERDVFDNIYKTETFGTTKGKAFTSKVAAQKYADQILGEVIDSPTGGFLVAKKSNVPTGWYSQGATPKAILEDTNVYGTLDTDELGRGFFANFGSPLSQTDWTNNALLKQGEMARAKALSIVEADVAKQLRLVGKEGKQAVEKVFTELRDGSLAHLREAPSAGAFSDYFFKINGRQATADEARLYELKLDWNDTDWLLSADMHFKREVNRGIEILVPQDGIETPAAKVSRESLGGRQVWDADSGRYVAVDSLPDDRVVYRLVTPMEFDGKLHDLVASAAPKTRALKHTDVMGYNAGGSRIYAHNKTNFIVKQETEYTLADGVSRKGNPRTLMVAKTEKEARKAQDEINSVIREVNTKVDPKAFTKAEDYANALKTVNKDAALNEHIAKMSAWNTDVHSVENLIEFAIENKLDLRKPVQFVGDNQPLVTGDDMIGDITFKDVAVSPGLLKFGDFRRDNVLIGYGGQKVPTIAPFESISRSLMSSVARQTNLAYETRSIMRLYRTALEQNLISRENIAAMRNMSLRQKAKNMFIVTSTDAGKKLELERKKILSRIEGQRYLDVAYANFKDELSNILWDRGWKKTSEKIDALSDQPVAATRGIVFDSFFWGAIDQVYVQGSQIFSIAAISDKIMGVQAAAVAPVFRGTLLNGHRQVDEAMAKLMAKPLGVDPKQAVDMLYTFRMSGKGAVQASVADLGEDSAGKILFQKIREKGRLPYTEGELMSRITAHIAASKEYLAKFGADADLKSQKAMRWVMHESDKLTHAMSSTSRHPIEQLPMMQFMSYSLRMTEYLLGGIMGGKSVLTGKQKIRLATMQLGLFGAGAVPFGGAAFAYYEYKYGTGLDEETYKWVRKGTLDGILSYMTGVETDLGQRLAWGEGMFNTISDLQDKNVFQVMAGPTGSLVSNIWESTNKLLTNIKYGGSDMLAEDFIDVAKSMKFANMYHNAYLAFRDGIYRSRSGKMIDSEVTFGESMAIALGIPLEKVNSVWDEIENRKTDDQYYKELGKKVSSLYYDLHVEVEKNGWGTRQGRIYEEAISRFYALHHSEVSKFKRFIDNKFITMYEQTVINQARRDNEKLAQGATN